MPYIKPEERTVEVLADTGKAGQLNYCISCMVHQYIQRKGLSYQVINEVIGVLECAKLELYRQIAAPYENEKKEMNGSVSALDSRKVV